jgi:hypothetical protein
MERSQSDLCSRLWVSSEQADVVVVLLGLSQLETVAHCLQS